MDGFYIGYLTGRAGNTVILFVIRGGEFFGVDAGGMKYNGRVNEVAENTFRITMSYEIPPGVPLITGAPPSDSAVTVPLEVVVGADFANGQVISIEAATGPINARFEKVREL